MTRSIRPSILLNRRAAARPASASARPVSCALLAAALVQLVILLMPTVGLSAQEALPGSEQAEPKPIELQEVRIIDVKNNAFRDTDVPDDPSYTRSNASSANRINVPVMQTPMSIQVVPRAVIRDQQAV